MSEHDILKRAAWPFGLAAAAILIFMMLFTTVTVIMRQLFGLPVLGVVDVMELSLLSMIYIAMPGVFLRDDNVTVDVIDHLLSRKARVVLRLLGLLLSIGFLGMMIVTMLPQAMDKWQHSEVTMTLSIPRYIHWTPIIFGFLMSILGTAWVLIHYLRFGFPTDPNLDHD